jgi:hypothetical protein
MSNRISPPASNLLDRTDPSGSAPLSENQTLVDQLVSTSMNEATKGSMLVAMLGAGAVSRLTRAGVMSVALGEGGTVLPMMARGGSYAIALANESATFAGIERGFHPSQVSFEKDWARSFINLGSLKLLGGAAQGQNLFLQHLLTDLGMVTGQQVGAAFKITERPQGSLAQQMVQAEALNWSMKGGMGLLQGLSPNLLAMEKSMDLYLRSRERDFSSQGPSFLSPFRRLVPAGSYGNQAVPASSDGIRDSMKDSGPSRENLVFAMGDRSLGSGASRILPTPEEVAREIGRLHQSWLTGKGEILIGGNKIRPAEVNLDDLQAAIWQGRRPIIVGDDALSSNLWGGLKSVFRNLNNPTELYKRDLGHAHYLLGLSIVVGKPLENMTLPKEVRAETPQYPLSPYELVWLRNQLTGSRTGLALGKQEIVDRFFGSDEARAGEVIPFVLGTSMERRGWAATSSVPSYEAGAAAASVVPEPARRRTLFDLSLKDVSHIILEDEGGPPRSHLDLTKAVEEGQFEDLLKDGYCVGWWTRLHKQGAYQANILGRVPEFTPEQIYDLLSRREKWTVFYPGFYHVERVRPLSSDQSIFRLGMRTPAGKIRMITKHTLVPSEFQVRWEDPTPEQMKGIDYGTESDEKTITRIRGGITAASTPSGEGSLILYDLFMTAQQTGSGRAGDDFNDLRKGEVATMARVPPLLTSLYAVLSANRDGKIWGITDPAELAAYRNGRDMLKGPEPQGIKYQPKVWVIDR